jgi:OAA-family lectin sugar binding domain
MTQELDEAGTTDGSVFEFHTETRRAQAAEPEPGPGWLLYLERGAAVAPTRLSFTAVDGAHSAVAFTAGPEGFLGSHRAADSTVSQLRGTLAGRRPYPALPAGVTAQDVLTFDTHEQDEQDTPDGWRRSGRLRLLLRDGRGVPLRDLEWQEADGTEVALSFTADRSGFLGHLRRPGAEPVGYRGFAVASRPVPTGDELVAELEEFGRQALGIVEDLAGRISGWLGGGSSGKNGGGPARPA